MKSITGFRSCLLALVCTTVSVSAQVVPQVVNLGGGAGAPPPSLNSTPPVQGADITLFLTGMPPGAPLVLFITDPVTPPSDLGGGAFLHVNPFAGMTFLGVADAFGAFTLFAPGAATSLFPAGLVCNAQAGVVVAQGTPGALDFGSYGVLVSNGVALVMGDAPLVPFTDIPAGSICTYSKGGYQGNGAPGAVLTNNFVSVFSSGMTVGIYNPGNGAAAPNGKFFTPDATGLAALTAYLSGGGPSGAFTGDDVNTSASLGAGNLGRQLAAFVLNVAFNDAAVVPSPGNFGDLVYLNEGNSLHGATVRQILAVAQNATAGLGLPAGYTYAGLETLVANLNLSFDNCVATSWAQQHLFLAE